ncbi:hypothetical protein [Alteromonas sp. RKMC-009]|uniref:hypothetical protein n=1 Tax=Alteromonas sp. RKMC-009 TaxID=2267264 RepID=UPI000E6A7A7A|nr:hypothetical protein [Alteromonas sp. RKMC-009]AYA64330.1 hypothetical protein DS731_10150 [Alteromonas sp. RKMC-009]
MSEVTLEQLKNEADALGVNYHPSIGEDKLAAKIAEFKSGLKGEAAPAEAEPAPVNDVAELKKQAGKLIRINVSCMNAAKKDWDGEIITAGNTTVGTFRKFVKFNTEEGWHVPQAIYNVLKARKYNVFYTKKTKNGVNQRAARLVNEFSIEVLPDLTEAELADLAKAQAARG